MVRQPNQRAAALALRQRSTRWGLFWGPLAFAFCALHLAAQEEAPAPRISRVDWPLIDLVVIADSSLGVQVLAAPNLSSKQGYLQQDIDWISFDPGAVHRWALPLGRLIDSVAQQDPKSQAPFASRPIWGGTGRAYLRVRFKPKDRRTPFIIEVSDTTSGKGWGAEGTRTNVMDLLAVMDAAAETSVYLPPGQRRHREDVRLSYEVDQPPRLMKAVNPVYPFAERSRWREGRVWLQYVVDSTGQVDPASIHALLADTPDFEHSAIEAITHAKFIPAIAAGRPVGILVFQTITFRMN